MAARQHDGRGAGACRESGREVLCHVSQKNPHLSPLQNNPPSVSLTLAFFLCRLALERAKLSKLLARLPGVVNNHERREELDEEILATEEKIGLMADLLRPVRHGAAAKIEGLTDGETGLWIPRAYGILGKDASMTGFWKEWLKAIVVPMTGGGIQRVPPSSPRVGIWQPLEKYDSVPLPLPSPFPFLHID